MPSARFFEFLPDNVTFRSTEAASHRLIYAPLCGPDDSHLKSAITPFLSGDIKLDKSHYLTKPASREDLRQPLRNFFIRTKSDVLSVGKPDSVEVGQLWHRANFSFPGMGLTLTAATFVPVTGENIEITRFTVKNVGSSSITFTPTAVIPVFGRALSNKHDHEHVTSLLNRFQQIPEGVLVEPTMLFNEEGHKPCQAVYYLLGAQGDGALPAGTFPTVDSFLGEAGTWERPEAVTENRTPRKLDDHELQGKEAAGALRFADTTLAAGQSTDFIVAIGLSDSAEKALRDFAAFSTPAKFDKAFAENQSFWNAKTSSIAFDNGDKEFCGWMRWVTLQPILRRIFGCSFLPDHDYGKGGKGWRDLWQDLLSLILIEPERVRTDLLNNFSGVRIDGSNATIIGHVPGQFIADRNAITRVWMDHGVWPFATTMLYLHQTGDSDFLFEKVSYFSDPQMSRTFQKDTSWSPYEGFQLKDKKGQIYHGTVLEHLLVQNLVQFFNVGDHNITRLESADWNDGLDMAFKHGESVAFMSFYAGNLAAIADLLERLSPRVSEIELAKEVAVLLDSVSSSINYDNVAEKKVRLFEDYFKSVQPSISGATVTLPVEKVIKDLRKKSEWMALKIRTQEKVSLKENGETFSWFNGYYDNKGERVEGQKAGHVQMTLTGQVFPIMHNVATKDEVADIVKAASRYLKSSRLNSFCLNTNFQKKTYLDMGRAFGFAYGTKENGAVFCHMVVMYAYALYVRGFVREGYEALRSLYNLATGENAKIYPGIPEYFDAEGRGMYHFLTGSASWYVLTLLTLAYGIKGFYGDLQLTPRLVAEEFPAGKASVSCQFAGRRINVTYMNERRLDFGKYRISEATINGRKISLSDPSGASLLIPRAEIHGGAGELNIVVSLS